MGTEKRKGDIAPESLIKMALSKLASENCPPVASKDDRICLEWNVTPNALAAQLKNYSRGDIVKAISGFFPSGGVAISFSMENPGAPLATQEFTVLNEDLKRSFANIPFAPLPDMTAYRTLPDNANAPVFVMRKVETSWSYLPQNIHWHQSWEALQRTIEAVGGKTIVIDEPEQNSRMNRHAVFARDPLVVMERDRKILVPTRININSNSKEMLQLEIDQLAAAMEKKGYQRINVDAAFQGGDVVMDHDKKRLFLGVWPNQADDVKAAQALAEATGYEVIPVKKTCDGYYHLDTGFARLPNGEYLIAPEMTDAPTLADIKKRIGDYIEIKGDDAKRMATNLIAVGNTLIMPACSEELGKKLAEKGYTVVTPEKAGLAADGWKFMDGAVRCTTLQIAGLEMCHPEAYQGYLRHLAAAYRPQEPAESLPVAPAVNLAQARAETGVGGRHS